VVADYDGMIRTTNPAQAATLVHTGKAQLFDVRSPEEYTESHIPNAQHLPMGSIFKQLDKLPRDKQIIIHCGSGLRSQVVTSMLQRIGFTNVRNLSGGIDAWQKAGLATESNT